MLTKKAMKILVKDKNVARDVQSLSDEDKELIKTVPFEELKDLINGSLSTPELGQPISTTVATKRGNKKRIMKNKNRLILRAYGEAQDKQDEVFNNFENMLKKVAFQNLIDTISQLKSSLVVAGVYSIWSYLGYS